MCSEQWSSLLPLSRHRFPSKALVASSFIPASGRHPMNEAIIKSNLKSACCQQHVRCIDHYDTFVARSHAPKKAMYDNALHPSRQSMLKLARNLKYSSANFSHSQGKGGKEPSPLPSPTPTPCCPLTPATPGPSQHPAFLDHGGWQPWTGHPVSPHVHDHCFLPLLPRFRPRAPHRWWQQQNTVHQLARHTTTSMP